MLRRYLLAAIAAASLIVCQAPCAQEQQQGVGVAQTLLPSPSPVTSSPPPYHPIVYGQNTPFPYTLTPSGKRVPWNSPGGVDLGYNFKHPAQFPRSAILAHHQGSVIVMVHLDANAVVTDARVENSSGYPDLDQSALEAAKGWKYEPPYKSGVPQPSWVHMPVNFAFSESPVSK